MSAMQLRKIGAGYYETPDGRWQIVHQTETSGGYRAGGWVAYMTADRLRAIGPYERLTDLRLALEWSY